MFNSNNNRGMRFDVKHPLPHYQLSGPTKDGALCAPFQWNHSPHGLKGFIRSRQGWAWKSHKTWCARVFGGSMEGFEHPGSKQETKKSFPGGRGALWCWSLSSSLCSSLSRGSAHACCSCKGKSIEEGSISEPVHPSRTLFCGVCCYEIEK